MFDIKKIAQSAIKSDSPVMKNRVKVTLESLIKTYAGIITITAFDVIKTGDDENKKEFPVFTFYEDDNYYFFGGKSLSEIFVSLVEQCGSIDAVNDELKKCGGLKIKAEKIITKTGKSFTKIEIE